MSEGVDHPEHTRGTAGGHVRLPDLAVPRVELPFRVVAAPASLVPTPRTVPGPERLPDITG